MPGASLAPATAERATAGEAGEGEEDGVALSEQVLVEGTRREGPDPQSTAAAVTVLLVDGRLSAAEDVAALLDTAPGATLQRLGGLGDWSGVSIRGSTPRQVIVALDGVPLNPDGSSVINLSELPLGAFRRVELYRGNAPAELGASPVGGVVNLVTGEGLPPRVAALTAGSYDTLRALGAGALSGQLGGEPADAWGMVEWLSTKGDFTWFDDNGTTWNLIDDRLRSRENNEKIQVGAHGRVRVGGESLRLTLLDALLVRDEQLPGHMNAPATEASLQTLRNLGVAELEMHGGGVRGSVRAWGWGRGELYDDRLGELGTGQEWTAQRTAAYGLLGSAHFQTPGGFVPAVTYMLRRESWAATDLLQQRDDGPRRRLMSGLTLSGTRWLAGDTLALEPRLSASALDNHDLLGPDGVASPVDDLDTTLHLRLDPRLGVLWRPRYGLAVKANLGTAWRPPDMSELFGDRGTTVGNPELLPERAVVADLGLRALLPEGAWARGSAELGVFSTHTRDLIAYVQTGQQVLVPVNLGQTRAAGVEGALDLALGAHLESGTAVCWTHSENLSSNPQYAGKQLPRVPEWELSQTTALVWEGRLPGRLGHSFTYLDDNYWDAANVHRAAPRALHDAHLRVAVPGRPISVELAVQNLLDRQVEVVARNPQNPSDTSRAVQAITDLDGYPLPGRTFLLSVKLTPELEPE